MANRRERSPDDIGALLVKALLSSGLFAVLASLSGLMYRTGWLNRFGVDTDLFLPQSAAEISLWTFVAAAEIWAAMDRALSATFWSILLFVASMVLIGVLAALAWTRVQRRSGAFNTRVLALRHSKWAGVTATLSGAVVFASLVPWLAVFLAALLLFVPSWSSLLGHHAADKSVAAYDKGVNAALCNRIEGPAGELASCALVIAQTKERVAFLKGDQVHVIPSDGLHISWRRPGAKNPN